MTEEIISDGVNVAGCDAYKDKHCKDKTSIMFCDTNLCSNFPNCHYKQFKRLEQENNAYKQSEQEAIEIIAELKQKNKELKIYILEAAKQQVEKAEILVMDNDRLRQEVENLKDVIYYDVEKYCSALEEIRKIVTSAFAKQRPYKEDFAEIENIINKVLNKG